MKAMIMAAGVGSRLMPLTSAVPKPMIPMANQPLMENTVKLLQQYGFNEIIANLYYHADSISDYFGDGSGFGVNMIYSREKELMGTAGGVKNCAWFLNDTFIIVSGDALTDANLGQLISEHKKNGALATIALKEVSEVEHFGIVITDENGKITNFQEKPSSQEALSHNANTGIYVFEPEIFNYIPDKEFYDFGKQVFPHLAKIGAPFYGVNINGYWCDVGSLDTYRQSHDDVLRGRVSATCRGRKIVSPEGDIVLLGKDSHFDAGARLKGSVVLGDASRIEAGAQLQNVIVWDNTLIKGGCVLQDCVVGSNCCLENGAIINRGAVLASGCKVPGHTVIPPGSRVTSDFIGYLQVKKG